MADGKVHMSYKRFLGYAKSVDGTPEIVETEATVVRQIYTRFLGGQTYREIAACLTEQGILTPGKKEKWSVSTIQSILQNEKYAGNAILQKKYTVDFLSKKTKVNEGEVPQYFVENSHPAIIPPETYEVVQAEVRRRKALGKQLSGSGMFTCKIVCGDCGSFYGSKVWDSNNQYRREVWQCNRKYRHGRHDLSEKRDQYDLHNRCDLHDQRSLYDQRDLHDQCGLHNQRDLHDRHETPCKHEKPCNTPHLTEETIQNAFVQAFNQLLSDREQLLTEYEATITKLSNVRKFDKQTALLQTEYMATAAEIQEFVSLNARTAQDQETYQKQYDALVERGNAAKLHLDTLKRKKLAQTAHREKLRRFHTLLTKSTTPLSSFNEPLWRTAVESLMVHSSGKITVAFQSGTEIRVEKGNRRR